jgi:hypothetical protein
VDEGVIMLYWTITIGSLIVAPAANLAAFVMQHRIANPLEKEER